MSGARWDGLHTLFGLGFSQEGNDLRNNAPREQERLSEPQALQQGSFFVENLNAPTNVGKRKRKQLRRAGPRERYSNLTGGARERAAQAVTPDPALTS